MEVAVIGGRGFIGEKVVEALEDHEITTVDPHIGGKGHVSADITVRDSILPALEGFDAAVNLAGLTPMRRPGGTSYEKVQSTGAANVAEAAEMHGMERLVHMSALGADPSSKMDYLRTKGEGEEKVRDSGVETTVLRPSIIFDRGNELVELASRFAPTRVFPGLKTRIQPVYRGDVAELFRLAVEGEIKEEVLEVGGLEKLSMYGFAREIYRAKGYRCLRLPVQPVMKLGFYVSGFIPLVPYGADQARFLGFDNTTDSEEAGNYVELQGYRDWVSEQFSRTS